MSEQHSNPDDHYSPELFEDSIDDMCRRALSRLQAFSHNEYGAMEEGDVSRTDLLPELDESDFEHHIRRVYFSAVADDIHRDIMRSKTPPDYLVDLTAHLLACGFDEQAKQAGNAIVQLVPSEAAVKSLVHDVWKDSQREREADTQFEVHRFLLDRNQVSVAFTYDQVTQTWVLGYGQESDIIMLGWLPAQNLSVKETP